MPKPLFKKRCRPQKRLFYRTHLDDCCCLYYTRDWKISQPLEDLKTPAKIKSGKEILRVQEYTDTDKAFSEQSARVLLVCSFSIRAFIAHVSFHVSLEV